MRIRRGSVQPKRRRRKGGFTLVELTIVLSIVVILSGLLVLRVGGWSSRQSLHASARALGNSLVLVRGRAELEERPYRLVVEGGAWKGLSDSGELVARGKLASGQEYDGPKEVRFDGRGIAVPARLEIRNAAGDRVAIVVSPLSNAVEYHEAK